MIFTQLLLQMGQFKLLLAVIAFVSTCWASPAVAYPDRTRALSSRIRARGVSAEDRRAPPPLVDERSLLRRHESPAGFDNTRAKRLQRRGNDGQRGSSKTLYEDPRTESDRGVMVARPLNAPPPQTPSEGGSSPGLNPNTLGQHEQVEEKHFEQKAGKPKQEEDEQSQPRVSLRRQKPGRHKLDKIEETSKPEQGTSDETDKKGSEERKSRKQRSNQDLARLAVVPATSKQSRESWPQVPTQGHEAQGPSKLNPSVLALAKHQGDKELNQKAGLPGNRRVPHDFKQGPPTMTEHHHDDQYSMKDTYINGYPESEGDKSSDKERKREEEAKRKMNEDALGKNRKGRSKKVEAAERQKSQALNDVVQAYKKDEGPSNRRKISTMGAEREKEIQEQKKAQRIRAELEQGTKGPVPRHRVQHWLHEEEGGMVRQRTFSEGNHQGQGRGREEGQRREQQHRHQTPRVKQSCLGRWCSPWGGRADTASLAGTHRTDPTLPPIQLVRADRQRRK